MRNLLTLITLLTMTSTLAHAGVANQAIRLSTESVAEQVTKDTAINFQKALMMSRFDVPSVGAGSSSKFVVSTKGFERRVTQGAFSNGSNYALNIMSMPFGDHKLKSFFKLTTDAKDLETLNEIKAILKSENKDVTVTTVGSNRVILAEIDTNDLVSAVKKVKTLQIKIATDSMGVKPIFSRKVAIAASVR